MRSCYASLPDEKGFTLVETLMVISIMAILLALAVPDFSSTIRNIRLTTISNDLLASLNLARSEAVKRGRDVVVRKKGANWEEGWQIFVDVDRTSATAINKFNDSTPSTICEESEDCLLRDFPSLPANFTLRGFNNLADFIRFTPAGTSNYVADGLTNNANDYFVICDNRDGNNIPESDTSRLITLNILGKPRLALDTDNTKDGIPNLSTGSNLSTCSPT